MWDFSQQMWGNSLVTKLFNIGTGGNMFWRKGFVWIGYLDPVWFLGVIHTMACILQYILTFHLTISLIYSDILFGILSDIYGMFQCWHSIWHWGACKLAIEWLCRGGWQASVLTGSPHGCRQTVLSLWHGAKPRTP